MFKTLIGWLKSKLGMEKPDPWAMYAPTLPPDTSLADFAREFSSIREREICDAIMVPSGVLDALPEMSGMRVFESPYVPSGAAIKIRSFQRFGLASVPPMHAVTMFVDDPWTRPSILNDFEAWFAWAKRKHDPNP